MADSLQQLLALAAEPEVHVVVSDLDGVLRVFDEDGWAKLDAAAQVPPGSTYSAILGNPYFDDVTRGRGTHARWRQLAAAQLTATGASPEAAERAVTTWATTPAQVDRRVLEVLLELRGRGMGVFVFTNGTDRVPAELDQLGLLPLLGQDQRFLLNSADLGAAKPDPAAFARAHARIEEVQGEELRPDQVAFLDDSLRHVRGAEAFGWRAVHHVTG